jgi:hypothetical protein
MGAELERPAARHDDLLGNPADPPGHVGEGGDGVAPLRDRAALGRQQFQPGEGGLAPPRHIFQQHRYHTGAPGLMLAHGGRDLFLLDAARCHEGFADEEQNDVGTVQRLLDCTVPFAPRNDVPVMTAQNQIAPGKQFQVLIQRVPRLFVLVCV